MSSVTRTERATRVLIQAVLLTCIVSIPLHAKAETESTSYGRNCVLRVASRGCAALDVCDVEYRSIGRELAHDCLLRTDSGARWDPNRLEQLANSFGKMAGSLGLYATDIDLGYQVRVMGLDLAKELRDELERVVAPGFRKDPGVALPERFARFEDSIRKLCIDYVYIRGPKWPHVFVILPSELNPLYALSVLRSVPEVLAAGLVRLGTSRADVRRVVTGSEGEDVYLKVTWMPIDSAIANQMFLVATKDEVRVVPSADAAPMAGFRLRELPADAWLKEQQ